MNLIHFEIGKTLKKRYFYMHYDFIRHIINYIREYSYQ